MSTEAAVLSGRQPVSRSPGTVVVGVTAKKAVRSAVVWGYIFGVYVAVSAFGYAATYKTTAAREKFAQIFSSNAGLDALIGRAHDIQTVPGFTAWRCLGVLSIVGGVWGLLTATRLLRGEEDAGRWELLLAGRTTRRGAAGQALGGLAVGVLVLWVITALITVVAGQSSKVHISASSGMFFALSLVSSAAMFLAIGATTSQLAATRRQAAGYAAAVLGVSYALRMVADSGTGLDWLRWLTPLGWAEELRPLTDPHPFALFPIGGLVVVLTLVSVRLSGARDLRASVLRDRSSATAHTSLLSGPTGLTVRLMRSSVLPWTAAVAFGALLIGYVSKEAGKTLQQNSSVQKVLTRLGAPGFNARTYLGVAFLIVAVMATFVAAGQLGAARSEEAEGRLEHLLVRPVSRWSWLCVRLGASALFLLALGVTGGVFAWLGAASQHAGVSVGTLLEAGLNTVAPAVCVLGVGTLVFGVWPRATSATAYGVIAWSFLVEIVGGAVNLDHWVMDSSVFHQMAAAPAVAPNWTTATALAGTGVAGAILGLALFHRRDLIGE